MWIILEKYQNPIHQYYIRNRLLICKVLSNPGTY